MRHLAVVPARKGSEGLPGKNALELGGRSLTRIALETAKESGCFTDIVLSSDWEQLLDEATELGFKALPRPALISGPDTAISEVLDHVIATLPESYDSVCCLNPTSPFRSAQDIRDCYKLFDKLHPQGVVSVMAVKPLFMTRLRRGKRHVWHAANFSFQNRQRRKPMYAQNGAVYITDLRYFRETKRQVGDKVIVHLMSKLSSLDIDDMQDYLTAQALYPEFLQLKGKEPQSVQLVPLEASAPAEPGTAVPDGGS